MSQKAIEFIEKLDRGNPPMDCGNIIFEGGFFSCPFWYRYNNRNSNWEWSNDLICWNSVFDKVDKEIFYVSSDNIYIINYLRLKSKSKHIIKMETNLKNLQTNINQFFNNSLLLDRIPILDKLLENERVQDYLNQLSFERNIYENQLSQFAILEMEYSKEMAKVRTRVSLKTTELNFMNQMDILKLEIIESRFKYNCLIGELNRYLYELNNKNDEEDLLINYKLEDQISQAVQFFNGNDTQIMNQDLSLSFLNYQIRLLGLMKVYLTGNLTQNQLAIENGIVGYQNSLENLSKEIRQKNNYIDELQKMNQLLSLDNTNVKKDNLNLTNSLLELENISKKDKKQLENIKQDIAIKMESINSSINRINILETQIQDLENIRLSLVNENQSLNNKYEQLNMKNINLEKTNHELERKLDEQSKKNRKLINDILEKCPNLSYNDEEQIFENREDTYDIINLENE